MFNPKISGIIAGIAFTLSFLTGLFTGSQFFPVLLRAIILGIVFFVLSSLAYWLISRFLPELLASSHDESGETDVSGSKIDISIDSSDEELEAGNFGNTESSNPIYSSMQGLDQKQQDDYNEKEAETVSSTVNMTKTAAVPEADASESVDVLPDLESMSGSFTQTEESDDESDVVEMEDDLLPSTPSMSGPSRTQKSSDPGDFNAQEMASAIQTILRRDEKG